MEKIKSALIITGIILAMLTAAFFWGRHTGRTAAEALVQIDTLLIHDTVEFTVLRQTVEFLQAQLQEKEQRFAQQTELVRNLNAEVLELTKAKGKIELELQTYRCIRKKCGEREPQNGY